MRPFPAEQIVHRTGKCRGCYKQYEKERRRRRGSSTARGLGHQHQQLREQVLREARYCWICGGPGTPDDPLTADHVIPRAAGGTTRRSNLRAAHSSCNARRRAGGGGIASKGHSADPATCFPREKLANRVGAHQTEKRTCPRCGEALEPRRIGRPRIYCPPLHAQEARGHRRVRGAPLAQRAQEVGGAEAALPRGAEAVPRDDQREP
jgi:5-methylcytosine-specific restriction enzyme A